MNSTLTRSALTKLFVVKITVERCDVLLVGVPQIFDRVKSVALWSAKKKKLVKRPVNFITNRKFTSCWNISILNRLWGENMCYFALKFA
jgi:hypothetical protein